MNMICELCKKNEATNITSKLAICDVCLVEIQLSFSYHVGGRECTKEEHDRAIHRQSNDYLNE
jgi:hypothetical protein